MAGLARIHAVALVLGIAAAAMMLPAIHAAVARDWETGRAFLYAGLFTGVAAALLAFAMPPGSDRGSARRELTALLLAWIVVPAFAAVPLVLLTPQIGLLGAYFEMMAQMTTTGGTVYGDPLSIPTAVHLWRGCVAWIGGLVALTAAYVVLAPRRLGGFEIEAATWRMQGERFGATGGIGAAVPSLESRILRAMRVILPAYLGLTAAVGLTLSAAGQGGLAAGVHAMAVVSTTGISPTPEGFAGEGGRFAELAAAVFLVLAATRLLYARASPIGSGGRGWRTDVELWMLAALVGLVTAALFLRHWIGALTLDLGEETLSVLDALWGTVFTVISFATTTGYVSDAWDSARDWSGLANPGLFLLAVAAIGGGAATTAGGIKLIRAYALLRHGMREIERIAQPNSVLGVGVETRSLLREGPLVVWAFIMLFIFAILITVIGLTLAGLPFDEALIAAIAAISNTGPAFETVTVGRRGFVDLTDLQRMILAVAMLVGRFETLALVALMNPIPWGGARGREERGGKSRRNAAKSA